MMAVCAMCGKRVAVYWPEFYVYRRGERFFCGANCMEVYDVQRIREWIGWIDDWKKRNAEGTPRRKRGRPRKDPAPEAEKAEKLRVRRITRQRGEAKARSGSPTTKRTGGKRP